MNMQELHVIAKSRGIRPEHMYKTELIRSIQLAEGNFDCFGTAKDGQCDQMNCCWRKDCLELSTRK